MPDTPDLDAAYWRRAFLAAIRWPYSGLSRDLREGEIPERDKHKYDPGYLCDFETVRAALNRAGVRHG